MGEAALGNGLDEEMARAAGELLPDGLVVADDRAVVVGANGRAAQVTGIAVEDLLGRDIREVLPLHDADGTSWWDCTDPWHGLDIRTGHREKLLVIPGGPQVLVTAKYHRPGRNQPVARVLVCLRDAEARRRAEQDQAALLSTVAHELRSPLTSVKGFSSTLLKRWDRFTDDQKRLMLETIEADADRVTRLITELLDVSRLDTGQLRLHPQPVPVASVLDRHVERFVASGAERDGFTVAVADGIDEAWADPDRLDQILVNLIDNALKHGEGRVTIAAGPASAGPGDDGHGAAGPRGGAPVPGEGTVGPVDLTISDDGPGIPPHQREIVFNRFWQGGNRGSSGLGLYIVRGLAEAHGGRVVVEDAPSGGARMRVSLPGEPRPSDEP